MTPQELLNANGIYLKSYQPGERSTICPQCSHTRVKKKVKCLGVLIDNDGACWKCHHCGYSGGSKGNGRFDADIVATYDYPGFQKVRFRKGHVPPFLIRHRVGQGWKWDAGGADINALYRIDQVNEAIANDYEIAVVEGEKDADRLWLIGIPATTSALGAAATHDKDGNPIAYKPKWYREHSVQLRGAKIVVFNDNDPQGYAHAETTCKLSLGVAARVRRLDLAKHWPDMPKGGDVSDWLAAGHTREQLDALIEAAPDWTPQPEGAPEQTEVLPLVYVDISKWINAKVPKRQWAVLNRIPAKNVTVLSGTGGTGKTIIAMQLAVAVMLGLDWFGTMPERGPVIFLSAEEDHEEMHRRFADITEHLGASYQDLIDGGLHLIDKAGRNAMLARPGRNGVLQPTALLDQLRADAHRLKPKLVILDNRNRVYGGNINDPTQVSDFICMMHGFAIDADTSILLILHPSIAGMAAASDSSHQGIAGAMPWHDLPRGRMFFNRVKTDDEKEIDKDLRTLVCKKNNYGPDDETITLKWKTGTNGSGVFVMEAKPGSLEKIAADSKVDELFLTLLQRLNDQNRGPFSHKKQSNNYAPKVLAALPEIKDAGITKTVLAQSMNRLLDTKRLAVERYGPPSKEASKLVTTT
jgi:RecA-family ATPase